MTPVDITPDGCRHCSEPQTSHGRLFTDGIGWHSWTAPTSRQRLARRLARRRMRRHPGTDALINDLKTQEAPAVAPAEAIPNPNERTLMSEINPIGRPQVIAGLRALADFLEAHPEVPAYEHWKLSHHATGTTAERRAEVDQIAAVLGVEPTGDADQYEAVREFGPVTYSVVAISTASMDQYLALRSYAGNVQVDAPAKAVA